MNMNKMPNLIKAAPDLYYILKHMNHVEDGYCICPANDGYLPYEKHASVCVMAQKALAKAEKRVKL